METQYCTYIFETKGYGLMDGKTRAQKSRDTIPFIKYLHLKLNFQAPSVLNNFL